MLMAKFVVATRMRHGVHGISAETTTAPLIVSEPAK